MNSIIDKMPAFGMPVPEGPINKPEVVNVMPEGIPPAIEKAAPQPCPSTFDPAAHPAAIPGSDVEHGMPGPGFPGGGSPKSPPFPRCESIDVIDAKLYVTETPYAEIKGELSDSGMINALYKTDTICINGVYVGGKSDFSIENSVFECKGYGIDDFAGNGSAVMVSDDSKVSLIKTNITTDGVIRPCTTANENSTLIVRNCVLDAHGGEIPQSYVPRIGSGMMEPPPGLKLGGNCRTHLSMGNSKAYFYDSTIIANSWAALSTDGSMGDLYLEANDCTVICKNIGYGTYADNGCYNVLNRCRINVATHVAIIAGEASVKLHDCVVCSGKYCDLIHSIRGHYSVVTEAWVRGGSYDIGEAMFLVRSNNAYISVDGAKIKTGKYLLCSEINDDPIATVVPEDQRLKVYGIKAVFSNGTYIGDIVHNDDVRTMAVTFVDSHLQGAVQNAYIWLKRSTWTATADSNVALVGNTQVSAIDAPANITITALAGEGCELSGAYRLASGGILIVK